MMKKNILTLFLLCAAVLTGVSCSDDKADDSPKVYRVGDFYNSDNVKGIVYAIEDGGRHGMIVSLDETTVAWATKAVGSEPTGADDDNNAADNMAAIQRISGWRTKFPAFAWCADKNTNGVSGWVLPAYAQLRVFYIAWKADEVSFNKALTDNGGKSIDVSAVAGSDYWSSTEGVVQGQAIYASSIEFFEGALDEPDKTEQNRVRAVREF